MALASITQIAGTGVPVPGDDIDTDRIIPARFMKCVTFDGLGEFAFYDARRDEKGGLTDHPLNDPRYAGASILVSGRNFGCGSSREHAPQALYKAGFRAIVAESFAEIFFGNSITLGMPCVVLERGDLDTLSDMIRKDPPMEITIDLSRGILSAADTDFPALVPDHVREALSTGKWDAIAELLEGRNLALQKAAELPYTR